METVSRTINLFHGEALIAVSSFRKIEVRDRSCLVAIGTAGLTQAE